MKKKIGGSSLGPGAPDRCILFTSLFLTGAWGHPSVLPSLEAGWDNPFHPMSEPLPPHSPSSPDCRQNAPGCPYCTRVANRRSCCCPAKSHEINVRSKILTPLPLLNVPIRTWRPEMMPKGESAAQLFPHLLRCNSAIAQTRLCNLELICVSQFQCGSKDMRRSPALLLRFSSRP